MYSHSHPTIARARAALVAGVATVGLLAAGGPAAAATLQKGSAARTHTAAQKGSVGKTHIRARAYAKKT